MAGRSLRDELLRGSVAARKGAAAKKRAARIWWISGALVSLFVVVIAAQTMGESESPSLNPSTSAASSAEETTQSNETQPRLATQSPAASADSSMDQQPAPAPTPQETSVAHAKPVSGFSAEVWESLDSIPILVGPTATDYDRALFGQAWYDFDRNGCDTRNDILRRDIRDAEIKSDTNGCKVLGGVLDDWYSGTTVSFTSGQDTSRLVQVDHVVPLAWAWRQGANEWDEQTRLRFANDPLNLNATTDQMNQSKSDSGPAKWLPGDDAAQCRYIQRFVQIVADYDLTIGLRDRAAARGVLIECSESDAFGIFAESDQAAGLVR